MLFSISSSLVSQFQRSFQVKESKTFPLGCVCVCTRACTQSHFPFFYLPDTSKNFHELLHPSPGCTWQDTLTHIHNMHTCALRHTHRALLWVVPRPDRKLDSGKLLAPPLAQSHVFLLLFIQRNRKWRWVGTVHVQKSRFCPKRPAQLRACPAVACPSSGGLRRPACAPGGLSRSGGVTLQVGPCPGVLG